MYLPEHFEEKELGVLHDTIEAAPLGTLVIAGPGGLDANHVPFQLDRTRGPYGTLRCHVARANPVWRAAAATALDALVVFQGPAAYISPNWYASKQTTHEVVPTYNYVAVHAHGRLIVHDDERWLRALLAQLTKRFEAAQPRPWRMGEAPAAYLAERLQHIVGLELEIVRIEGKSKLSQNRDAADQRGVIDGLRATASPAAQDLADAMENPRHPG